MRKSIKVSILLAIIAISFVSYGKSNDMQQSLVVNGDDLSCERYNGEDYFYVELSGRYDISNTVFDHRFNHFLFSNSCAQFDDLRGSTHEVLANVSAFPYNATICERGGSWYCHQYGCYQYRVEYVDLIFPNGLKLSSEVHTPFEEAPKIHGGQCASGL